MFGACRLTAASTQSRFERRTRPHNVSSQPQSCSVSDGGVQAPRNRTRRGSIPIVFARTKPDSTCSSVSETRYKLPGKKPWLRIRIMRTRLLHRPRRRRRRRRRRRHRRAGNAAGTPTTRFTSTICTPTSAISARFLSLAPPPPISFSFVPSILGGKGFAIVAESIPLRAKCLSSLWMSPYSILRALSRNTKFFFRANFLRWKLQNFLLVVFYCSDLM